MPLEKTFDPASAEPRISAEWAAIDAFAAGANAKPGADSFCIVIPPPNVTGSLHIGHALNNTLQDILIRWKRMQGFDVLWQPGQDHAGIATQMVVERQLAADGAESRRDMGRARFIERVWEWKERSGGAIIEQLKRLGASCDWSRNRFTMDEGLSEAVLKVFVTLYDKGLIYRGKRLVNWDPHFETAISDLEVENIEVDGHMWHFKYPLADGQSYEYVEKDENGAVTLREIRDYISIATTRPETMLGDGAVAVHPSDERYAPIVGKLCEIPVGPKAHRRLIPIITDEYPDPEFGSGAVKITGAHDFNDYGVAKRNGIPCYRLMDTKGALRADGAPYAEEAAKAQGIVAGAQLSEAEIDAINLVPDEYRGLDRFEARKRVIADITAEGLAVTVEDEDGNAIPLVEAKKIMQPFGDRSKVVIEPMLTDQWFVDAEKLAAPALEAVKDGRTRFAPENWEKTYFHWMENIEPWCISRQLWWGHQIPVWYDDEGAQYCAMTEEEARAAAGGKALTRDPDVLDTWFSSALWPFSTLGWPEETPELARYYKTDVLITGNDIIFFWVARMMMMGLEFLDEVPFHTVYINSIVTDAKGKKMSKSVGNVIDPLDLIDRYGADAVRFTLTSQEAQGRRQIRLAESTVEGGRNFITKLWNAARFAEMNGCAPTPGFDPAGASEPLNRWIVGETAKTRLAVDKALEEYHFNDAANALYTHTWRVFCDWYVEFSKPLLQGDDEIAAETRATMAWALDQILLMLHPIAPFATEALWAATAARDKPLVHGDWPVYGAELIDAPAAAEIDWVISVIERIRSVRSELNVNPGAKPPLILVEADADARLWIERNGSLIRRLARVESIAPGAAGKGAVTLALAGAVLALPLAGVIDVAAERARLQKAVEKAAKEVGGVKAKLSNPKFLAKAPDDVIEEQKERLAAAEAAAAKLSAALTRLAEIG
ncbi:valine--tRNA ligase [Pikeienuella sp. HZG-20]|uniref:valine--tRNA ligase n=1 Tax=Paludibacillus litoralis TaxID=3133267 RepID=UPI0030EDA072